MAKQIDVGFRLSQSLISQLWNRFLELRIRLVYFLVPNPDSVEQWNMVEQWFEERNL